MEKMIKRLRDLLWPAGASTAHKVVVVIAACTVLTGSVLFIALAARQTNDKKTEKGKETTVQEGSKSSAGTTEQKTDNKESTSQQNTDTNEKAADTAKPGDNGSKSSNSGGSSPSGGSPGGGSTPSLVCAAFPAFPDLSCTGYQHTGVTLHDCDTTLNDSNATYDSCLFDGGIVVVGSNITIKRSRITGIVSANWDANGSLRGLTLIDVEIDGSVYPDPFGQAAIGLDNYTCIRCDVHHTGRGANFRNNVRIEDSYFHDFAYVSGAHQSGVGSNGGSGNTILHNNIQCNGVGGSGCSGALVMYGDFDPIDNILVQNNLFNTDGSYCTYAGSAGVASGKAYPHGTNVRYIDNRFGKKYYGTCGDAGPVAAWENNSGNVWAGNAWADGSGTVNP